MTSVMTAEPFRVTAPDYGASPMTGMTRRHWIDCARYLVDRTFLNVADADSLFAFPDIPGRDVASGGRAAWLDRVQELEGFRRTMSVAAPLLHVHPDATAHGINVADYYRRHIVRLLTPGGPGAIPTPDRLDDGFYQFTCELGGMCQILLRYPDQFWPALTVAERDAIAGMLSAWGHARTQPHNWRFFNVMMLTFLKVNGYAIDDGLLHTHLDHLLALHGGDGWYDDGHFDFYSAWVFHTYALIYNRAYGDEHDPRRADIHERRFATFMESYPRLFARNGHMLMWGRSICYRFAAACAFPLSFVARRPAMDPGWARRLASGTMMQFLSREDLWQENVPSLGFYRHWEPLTQPYSNAASPYWMFLPFLALSLPVDSPFWTAEENDGPWPALRSRSETVRLPRQGLHLTNHGTTGTTELRPGHIRTPNPNYNRLCFNTHFPWEADNPDGATPMAYSVRGLTPELLERQPDTPFVPQTKLLGGAWRDGVLYRQVRLTDVAHQRRNVVDCADIILPGGVLRVDRCRVYHEHDLRLGHFGLPHADGRPPALARHRRDRADCLTAASGDKALALTRYHGWDRLDSLQHNGMNPDTTRSTVLYVGRRRDTWCPPIEVMITVMLHRIDGGAWDRDELFPVESFEIEPLDEAGSVGVTRLRLRDGRSITVDFAEIDGEVHG